LTLISFKPMEMNPVPVMRFCRFSGERHIARSFAERVLSEG